MLKNSEKILGCHHAKHYSLKKQNNNKMSAPLQMIIGNSNPHADTLRGNNQTKKRSYK